LGIVVLEDEVEDVVEVEFGRMVVLEDEVGMVVDEETVVFVGVLALSGFGAVPFSWAFAILVV
jgi:hypothetical protein